MYVIKKMRLNTFEPRPLVSNRELFVSQGAKPARVTSNATPDCFDAPTLEGASKTKILGLASEVVAQAKREHDSAGHTPPLKQENAKDK